MTSQFVIPDLIRDPGCPLISFWIALKVAPYGLKTDTTCPTFAGMTVMGEGFWFKTRAVKVIFSHLKKFPGGDKDYSPGC